MRKKTLCAVLMFAALLLGGVGTASAWDHGPRFHGFRGHPVVHTRIFVGPGFWWGPRVWWAPPYQYYYAAPPVVVQEAPPTYIQQQPQEQPSYWYYCPNPAGYYPDVKECPSGWMTVVPQATPPTGPPTP